MFIKFMTVFNMMKVNVIKPMSLLNSRMLCLKINDKDKTKTMIIID